MSLAKNLGGRVGVKEKFLGGEGSLFFEKFYFKFVKITRAPKNFFFPKKKKKKKKKI
jgi:hypothetical protein